MQQIDINKLSSLQSEQILDEATYTDYINIANPTTRAHYKSKVIERAREFKQVSAVKEMFLAYEKAEREAAKHFTSTQPDKQGIVSIEYSGEGKPLATINNFLTILKNDENIKKLNIRFNEQLYCTERDRDNKTVRWTDADDSALRLYMEQNYKIHHPNKLEDALRIVNRDNTYNPIKDIIEAQTWDGTERISTLFIKWLKCEDTPYTREVCRLFFAGAINRLYEPGCKFDDMPVLIGNQGSGKSTFVRWLSILEGRYYGEINEIDGQKGMEVLEGVWIGEFGELLALTRTKEIEAIKSYISSLSDTYRRPYDRNVTEYPRRCAFIGTTNKPQFLTDKTGNRRYYPIYTNQSGYELFDNADEIKSDILQCWAEAYHKYKLGQMPPVADRNLIADIKNMQSGAMEDDYLEGLILRYLEDKNLTCVIDVWRNALDHKFDKPSKKDSNEIGAILNSLIDWHRESKAARFDEFGPQKCWRRNISKQFTAWNELPE